MFITLPQNFCVNDMSTEFENGSGLLKNVVYRRGGGLEQLYLYRLKPCEHLRSLIFFSNCHMKLIQNLCYNDTLVAVVNGSVKIKQCIFPDTSFLNTQKVTLFAQSA